MAETSCPLKICFPCLPLMMVLQVLEGHTAVSLKTHPSSLEACDQILASGMWAALLSATSGFVLKRNGRALPWPFSAGWEVGQPLWTQKWNLCVECRCESFSLWTAVSGHLYHREYTSILFYPLHFGIFLLQTLNSKEKIYGWLSVQPNVRIQEFTHITLNCKWFVLSSNFNLRGQEKNRRPKV